MKSYIYPKLLRSELDPRYASSPDARSEAVNTALVETDIDTLTRAGLRRARQRPKVLYEPFGVALGDAALRVMNSLPASTSRSALIQWMLCIR
jgi:hypothetical protein